MITTFLRQTTEDKLILQGLLYEPDQSTQNLILHIHGMSGNFYENKFLDFMASTFTQNGWAFLSPNTRGHDFIADFPIAGDKEQLKRIGQTFEKFEESVLDIKAWMDYAESKGFKNIVLQGHSLGCAKVVYYYYKTRDKRIKKLVLASHADMVGFQQESDSSGEMKQLAENLVRQGKGNEILPQLYEGWSYISAATKVDFQTKGNPIDVFNTYNPSVPSKALESIDIPTLAFMGSAQDSYLKQVGSAQKSLEIIKSKAKNAPVFDIKIVDGAPHSYFAHEQEVADLIINWSK